MRLYEMRCTCTVLGVSGHPRTVRTSGLWALKQQSQDADSAR